MIFAILIVDFKSFRLNKAWCCIMKKHVVSFFLLISMPVWGTHDALFAKFRQTHVGSTLVLDRTSWVVETKEANQLGARIILLRNSFELGKVARQTRRIFTITINPQTLKKSFTHQIEYSSTSWGKALDGLSVCSLIAFGAVMYALGKQ